jgi:hypothetical protein
MRDSMGGRNDATQLQGLLLKTAKRPVSYFRTAEASLGAVVGA